MSRHIIIVAGILILAILGSAVYIHHTNSKSSKDSSTSSEVELPNQGENPEIESNSDTTGPGAPGVELQLETNSIGEKTAVFDYSDETAEPASIGQIQRAFAGQASIMEALQNAASEDGWGYDGLVKNLLFWKGLCSTPEPEFNQKDGLESGVGQTISERRKTFCAGFPSDFSKELRELGLVHMEETTKGVNDWSRRLDSISELGPGAALQLAIIDLDDALYVGNYGEIADIVWFLGTSGLLEKELSIDDSISSMFSDVEVMIAVNASLYCSRFGGCGSTHPVTLGLCFQFSERQCHSPSNLHHAAEQILTGRELVAFYRMQQEIFSLVSQHRRDKF